MIFFAITIGDTKIELTKDQYDKYKKKYDLSQSKLRAELKKARARYKKVSNSETHEEKRMEIRLRELKKEIETHTEVVKKGFWTTGTECSCGLEWDNEGSYVYYKWLYGCARKKTLSCDRCELSNDLRSKQNIRTDKECQVISDIIEKLSCFEDFVHKLLTKRSSNS